LSPTFMLFPFIWLADGMNYTRDFCVAQAETQKAAR
jgi:hypothetical protein